jgi:hypothetical protein
MASNPLIIDCIADVWTKCATNVTSGTINKLYDDDEIADPTGFLQTFRITGAVAPTLKSEGVICFENSVNEKIDSSFPIDVYIMALFRPRKIRVDLP